MTSGMGGFEAELEGKRATQDSAQQNRIGADQLTQCFPPERVPSVNSLEHLAAYDSNGGKEKLTRCDSRCAEEFERKRTIVCVLHERF
jgi:hypothetical protein